MTTSLDGYIAGSGDSVDAPMGIGGFRLFNWLDRRNDPGTSGQVFGEVMATRAVISGRRTYEHAGRWQGDHHDGVPVFVLTHHVPDDPPPLRPLCHRCARVRRAGSRGGRERRRDGARSGAAQALLRAGQLDELELHVVPVLLGQGRRLLDNLPADQVELELVRRLTTWTSRSPRSTSCTCATASASSSRHAAVRSGAGVPCGRVAGSCP